MTDGVDGAGEVDEVDFDEETPEEEVRRHFRSPTSLGMASLGPPRDNEWDRFGRFLLGWTGFFNNVLLIPMFTVMLLEAGLGDRVDSDYSHANLFFCVAFQIEFWLGFLLARSKRVYIADPGNVIDFISSIPFVYLLQGLRVARLFRIARVLRVVWRVRRFSGRGSRLVRAFGFVAAMVFAGALAIQIVEPTASGSFGRSLWWAIATLSTVGYGDIVPKTPAGHIVGTVVIVCGLGVFGYMAGFMTSLIEDPDDNEVLVTVRELRERLNVIQAHVEALTARDAEAQETFTPSEKT